MNPQDPRYAPGGYSHPRTDNPIEADIRQVLDTQRKNIRRLPTLFMAVFGGAGVFLITLGLVFLKSSPMMGLAFLPGGLVVLLVGVFSRKMLGTSDQSRLDAVEWAMEQQKTARLRDGRPM